MRIRLIGVPRIVDATGHLRALRGHQGWAVLARVLLTDRPMTRRELSAELFPEAADPLGALRWCLAEIRKAVGSEAMMGDPIRPNLPTGVRVDVQELATGEFDPAEAGEFLEGVNPRCGPEFELWLLVQRERVGAMIDACIRDSAMTAAAVGDTDRALRLAELGARRRPLDESAQLLLVSTLRDARLYDTAAAVAAEVDVRLRAEVGQSPSSALRSASRPPVTAAMSGVPAGTRAKSLVDAGRAALEAGAADSGVDTLRMACRVAEAAADWGLLAACRLELGTALVHAVRSRDDEGSLLLTHALAGAVETGDRATAAAAARELGYADTLAGRRLLAATHLHAAEEHAGDDGALLSGIVAVRAFNLAEWGRLDAGLADYEQAIALARSAGRPRDLAWALGLGAWARIAAGQYDLAADWAEECLRLTDDLRWMAFRPWPIAVRAELDVLLERVDSIEPLYEAYALSCQLGDPCWEGASARSLALAADARGEIEEAFAWLDRAITACRRETDTFAGMHAAVLATDLAISRRAGRPDRARATARTLLELSARHHLDRHLDIALAAMGRSPSGGGFLM